MTQLAFFEDLTPYLIKRKRKTKPKDQLTTKLDSLFGFIAATCEKGDLGFFNMRNETILNHYKYPFTGTSARSIQRALKQLVDAGYILVSYKSNWKNGRRIILTEKGKQYRTDALEKKNRRTMCREKVEKPSHAAKKNVAQRTNLTKYNYVTTPRLVEKSEQKQDHVILTEIKPQVNHMTNETRLDIGYERQNVDWDEIERIRKEEAAKKAEWERKDHLYGRYLGHKAFGGTEEQWRSSLLNSDFTVEEFESIKREWEGKQAV